MEDKIIIREALQVFEKIRKNGNKTNLGFELSGLIAITSHDGYTISVSNDYANLTIFFHNKFSFEATNQKEKQAFLEKLKQINKGYS